MGRPRKRTADWYPHYVADSRTKFILEDGWGNDGYAFWFKLLELLCKSDGHSYDCTNAANKKYLTAFTKLPEETVDEIMATLADLDKIDRELWEERKIIWCQPLVENLQMLYAKRTVSAPVKPFSVEFPERKQPENDISEDETAKPEGAARTPTAEPEERSEPKRGRKKAPEQEKIKYAEFVRMTEDEYKKLVKAHGEAKTKRMIEVLDNYKGSKGKTYKSDYRAILSWVVERVNEESDKKGGGVNYGGFSTNRGDTQRPATDPGGFKPSGGFKKES